MGFSVQSRRPAISEQENALFAVAQLTPSTIAVRGSISTATPQTPLGPYGPKPSLSQPGAFASAPQKKRVGVHTFVGGKGVMLP